MRSFKSRFYEVLTNSGPIHQCKLGELLIQDDETEKIIHTSQEIFVTLQSKGKGAKKREISEGKVPVSFTGYRIHAGQFIYSRIDARNGAFAIVPHELDGAVVSKDFPVFDINVDKVNPTFLLYSTLQTSFIQQIQSNSFGATNRQRIKEDVLSNYSIKIPKLELQNQFADFVKQVDKSKFILEVMLNYTRCRLNNMLDHTTRYRFKISIPYRNSRGKYGQLRFPKQLSAVQDVRRRSD